MPLSSSSCEAVLRENDRGRYTIPSPGLYPHQWAWDSAFAAIGWAYVDPDRGWTELETLMAGQWSDGRIPHIQFHDLGGDYFPGPDFWQTERSSSISQPPIWATAARILYERAPAPERLRALLEPFERSHRFFHEARDPNGWNAIAIVHPWESGLDNCPAWDGPMARVDVSNPPAFERRDLHATGDPSTRPTHDHYLRYACLVKAIARDGFGPGPFAVYDPMFTAILARAERDLAALAREQGIESEAEARAERLEKGLVEHLYDEERGRFVYHDARADERILCDVIGGYVPLWCSIDEAIARRLVAGLRARFAVRFPLSSVAPGERSYDPRRYWRGPTWVNVNWLLVPALGEELLEATLAMIAQGGLREYFHPESGEGLGGRSFSWTAALALDLMARSGALAL